MADKRLNILIRAKDLTAKAFGSAKRGLQGLREQTQQTSRRTRKSFASAMDMSAIVEGADRAASGLQSLLTGSIQAAVGFEESMAKVKAVTGASEGAFASLQAKARELGATTSFSASQAAGGMEFLARAGFKTDQILAAMPATLKLAQASSTDLARTADIASNVLTGFGLKASQMGRASDVFAKATASANTDLSQLGEAMKYVAPQAKTAGFTLEETTAIIGKLSDAGIQGSMAGTGMRAVINSLTASTPKAKKVMEELGVSVLTQEGQLKKMPQIIEEFQQAFKAGGLDASTQAKALNHIFGDVGASAFNALLGQGAPALKELTQALENSQGTADKMAQTMDNTAAGAMKRMQSAFEETKIMLGNQLLPMMVKVTGAFAEIAGKVSAFVQGNQQLAQTILLSVGGLFAFAKTVAMVGTVINGILRPLMVAGQMMNWITQITGIQRALWLLWAGVVKGATLVMQGLNLAMKSNPIGMLITLVGLLGAAFYALAANWEEIVAFFKKTWGDLVGIFQGAWGAISGFLGLSEEKSDKTAQSLEKSAKLAKATGDALQKIKPPPIEAPPKQTVPLELGALKEGNTSLPDALSGELLFQNNLKLPDAPDVSALPSGGTAPLELQGKLQIEIDVKNQSVFLKNQEGLGGLEVEAKRGDLLGV